MTTRRASPGFGTVLADRLRTGGRVTGLLARHFANALAPDRLFGMAPQIAAPETVVFAPPELLAGDARRGAALYAGTFDLAGTSRSSDGLSIFAIEPPSHKWAECLHGFSWLTDLQACDTTLARDFARAQIEDWLAFGQSRGPCRQIDVSARRVMSWLVHAPFLLRDADPAFHRRFLRSLGGQIRRLRRNIRRTPPGLSRLTAAIALTMAGLCLTDAQNTLRSGRRRLSEELATQILADGGHIGRNPMALIDILHDLLPLRQLFIARQIEPPAAMVTAIDRMLPMLRFFRHGDGAFALFNGMGPTPEAEVEAILAFDDARGRPVQNAVHAGYQRLEGGASRLIIDSGTPPPLAYGDRAHAGTLAFEFSVGLDRLVVNCGAPRAGDPGRLAAARITAAHSTLTLAGQSSSRFLRLAPARWVLGAPVVDGPKKIDSLREEGREGQALRVSHDGYCGRLGFWHERGLVLAPDGSRLDGLDELQPANRSTKAQDFALRFHLHPAVRANRLGEGRGVLLTLPSGEVWSFSVADHTAAIEESIFFADPQGPRRAEQIVIAGRTDGETRIAWSFMRQQAAPQGRRGTAAVEGGDLLI